MNVFDKIIAGTIPCFKLYESDTAISFLDINPLSPGHALVVAKHNATRLHELPQHILLGITLAVSVVSKAIVEATGCSDYNVIQSNGKLAGQEIMHVHFHIIPKPDKKLGLGLWWPSQKGTIGALGILTKLITMNIPEDSKFNQYQERALNKNAKRQVRQSKGDKSPTVVTEKSHSDIRLDELEKRVDMLTRTVTFLMKGTNSHGESVKLVTGTCPVTGKNSTFPSDNAAKDIEKCPITHKATPEGLPFSRFLKEHGSDSKDKPSSVTQGMFDGIDFESVAASTCKVSGCECTLSPTDGSKPCEVCKHGSVYHTGFHAQKMKDPNLFTLAISGDNMKSISPICDKLYKLYEKKKKEEDWPTTNVFKEIESKLKECSTAAQMKIVRSELIESGGDQARAVSIIEKELRYKLGEEWRDPFMAMGCPFGFDKKSKKTDPEKSVQTKQNKNRGACPFGFDK